MSALEYGISCDCFWDMSYGDIIDTIRAAGERQLHKQQRLSGLVFRLVNGVALAFNDPKKLARSQSDMFPELFKQSNDEIDWQIVKHNMQRYKAIHNAKIGGETHDSR